MAYMQQGNPTPWWEDDDPDLALMRSMPPPSAPPLVPRGASSVAAKLPPRPVPPPMDIPDDAPPDIGPPAMDISRPTDYINAAPPDPYYQRLSDLTATLAAMTRRRLIPAKEAT